ncbi:hypothetical protein Q8791_23385 [Nocardiopsis sp. CT-R113]|uniref:Uncharacterized protein n=1 Tax=Nocardiopsis codii TaxID=3065942 RepID=A0ABU7KD65_9ACTN|nr:hypothetical protein [Nocardiopsis sp. CT-R113]MEE2040164.1 hypothetical protein [Nocardiopsis sp. CT-R113]
MRYWYGGSPADYVISPGQQVQLPGEVIGYQTVLVPGVRLWVYDYDTGDRTTDLLNAEGAAVDHLVTAEYGAIPRFRGPDEVKRVLIGPEPTTGGGDPEDPTGETQGRWVITTTDWPSITDRIDNRLTAVENGSGGGGGEDPGEWIGTAHPLVWSLDGDAETHTSRTHYWNLEGKPQTVTRVRAQGIVTAGTLAVHVLKIDPDTGATTVIAATLLDSAAPWTIVAPEETISDGTGLTVAVELGTDADVVSDVAVQVMIR